MTEKNKIIPSACLILLKNNKILLSRRYNTGYEDGKYMPPSGHVELDESFTQAIIREIKEEIGIDIKNEDLKVVHTINRKLSSSRENWIDVFLLAKNWDGEVKNMEPEKCDDLNWFDIDNIPENTVEYIKFVIDKIKNNITYSEYGW